jgi:zinc transport system ATP-binding protein
VSAPLVRLRGGAVAHGRTPVLSGVDLRVDAGEVVAVLGANGAGKSTLVRAVVGLHPLAAGSLELFGVPAARLRERHRVGYVPQRVGATSGVPATVHEVVLSGRLHALRRFRRAGAQDREQVAHALEVVGLADLGRRPVAELSGGQQQRVLIARALVGDADLLVLDEPTSGVDLASQHALAAALDHLRTLHGKGVLLVAHELGPVRLVVSRAVVLRDGGVVHDGPLDQVGPDAPYPDDDHTAHPEHEEHAHAHAAVREPALGLAPGRLA